MVSPKSDDTFPEKASPARQRVLKHLRNAALTGAGLALACSGPGATGGDKGQGPVGGHPPAQEDDGPPIVCDPLPPPVDCGRAGDPSYLSSVMGQQARWVKAKEGLAVEVVLTLWARENESTLAFEEGAEVQGAKLLSHGVEGERFTLQFVPDKDVTEVTALLRLRCGSLRESMALSVAIPSRRNEGEGLEVKIKSR